MALLVEGKTVCRLCNQPIYSKAEAVGLPQMQLPAEFVSLNDSVVHRTCLMNHPERSSLSTAWKMHWQEISANSGQVTVALDGGMELRIKRRLVMVQFDTFIEIEERVEDFEQFNKFFASIRDGANEETSLGWNRYEISWVGGMPELLIEKIPSMSAGVAKAQSADVSLRYRFSSDEWNSFRSTCRDSL